MSSDFKIRIGTRTSKLALAQVAEVHLLIADHLENFKIEIVPIATSGDKIQDRNLAEFGGKGLFIKELEEALIQNKIDIAVHSAKDVPPIINEKTEIAAFTLRSEARDCLVSSKFSSLEKLPKGAIVGTSSARRKAILLRKRPDLKIVNFRGNVDTRINKVLSGEVDAAILAACGIQRIEKHSAIKKIIEVSEIIPAGGQGALALQARKEDKKIIELLKKVNHQETQICIKSERAFLRELGASCFTPVGVHASISEKKKLVLQTMIIDCDGSEVFETKSSSVLDLKKGIELGINAAQKTKKEAKELLQRICKN